MSGRREKGASGGARSQLPQQILLPDTNKLALLVVRGAEDSAQLPAIRA